MLVLSYYVFVEICARRRMLKCHGCPASPRGRDAESGCCGRGRSKSHRITSLQNRRS